MFEDADLIHRYSRADAIRDGVLIDVSATAKTGLAGHQALALPGRTARPVALAPNGFSAFYG
jgi:hypothetical protein